jgi:hypothetical protein
VANVLVEKFNIKPSALSRKDIAAMMAGEINRLIKRDENG